MGLSSIESAILGGMIIGLAVTMMLLFNGRVTGISGIINSSLSRPSLEGLWKILFIIGLLVGGLVVKITNPELLANQTDRSSLTVFVAGLFVGFGTIMGSGCTSGHGVCGISRFSKRSLVATAIFMTLGFLSVLIFNFFKAKL